MNSNSAFPCCGTTYPFRKAITEVSTGPVSLHRSSDSVETAEVVAKARDDFPQPVRTDVITASSLQVLQSYHPTSTILRSVSLPHTSHSN